MTDDPHPTAGHGPDTEPARDVTPPQVRRRATRSEQRRAVLSSVALAVLAGYAIWARLDVAARPVGAGVAIVLMAAGTLWPVLAAVFSWRTDLPPDPKLGELHPPATRWALRSELWAGRPGPYELRRYTRGWVARAFRAPANGAGMVFFAGWSLALGGLDVLPARDLWGVVLLALLVVLILFAAAELLRQRQAARIIDAVEPDPD